MTKNPSPITTEWIQTLCYWRNTTEARLAIYSPLFCRNIEVRLLTKQQHTISGTSIAILNDFLNLADDALVLIKAFLWENYLECCDHSDYGFHSKEGQTEREATFEAFGVSSQEDAYRRSSFLYFLISEENEKYKNRYGHLTFDNEWESHLSEVVMKNGKIVGCGESGSYLGKYEANAY